MAADGLMLYRWITAETACASATGQRQRTEHKNRSRCGQDGNEDDLACGPPYRQQRTANRRADEGPDAPDRMAPAHAGRAYFLGVEGNCQCGLAHDAVDETRPDHSDKQQRK